MNDVMKDTQYIKKGTKLYHKTNLAFFVAGFNTFTILYCVQPLLPTFTHHYEISPTVASLSLSLTTIALAIAMLFFGSLSDALGRKKVMLFSMIAASIICLVIPFSPTFQWLLILRTIQGIALAGLPSIAMAYLSEEISPKSLGAAMGLYICGNALGSTFGRMFSGMVSGVADWQTAIFLVGIISLIASIIFGLFLPRSSNFRPSNLDVGRMGRSLKGHLLNGKLICLFILGFILLGTNVAMFNYMSFTLLEEPYSLSQSVVSSIFLFFILGMVSSIIAGKMVDSYGKKRTVIISLSIVLVGVALTLSSNLLLKLGGTAISVYGIFSGHSVASSWVGAIVSQNKAQATSLYLFFYYAGSSVIGTLGGVIWSTIGWNGVVWMNILFIVIAFFIMNILFKKSEKDAVA
ncbi:YNFM family putative membrane transporter [Alkalicoccobacillus murimartini]|uniref:YNFM family putative membrane transporter n=2 Tax=Alkalicoccobacillus murimartini TaxID=171685 RepID=A0ABT9YDA7_9BACI|nr:YNFM family putative membrane transporter [Alkalicoccobacillus murimartini]